MGIYCQSEEDKLKLSFGQIEKITGEKINHSFLTYKKELIEYGWLTRNISIKNQCIEFYKKR